MQKRIELLADYIENEIPSGFSTSHREGRKKLFIASLLETREAALKEAMAIAESHLLKGNPVLEKLKKLLDEVTDE